MRTHLLWSILLFFAVFLFAGVLPRAGVHRSVQNQICTLVAEKFYRNDEQLGEWSRRCHAGAGRIAWWWSRERFLREVQWLLDEFEVSHLMVYDPSEDRRLWHGEAVDTGLRPLLSDEKFVVWKVLDGSVAQEMGIRAGDEIRLINGEPPRSSWQVETATGDFTFGRGNEEIRMTLVPRPLVVDRSPQLIPLTPSAARLEISSFRTEYFERENWQAIANAMARFARIVVDLRENSGGNLVGMLRALSSFVCSEKKVGVLSQPRRGEPVGPPIPDNLDEMAQLAMLESYREVPLLTYPSYGCYQGSVVVLVDRSTSSVSEIFADAMLARPNTKVWGRATAGDVVLATWYNLPFLGEGYSLSIPEALYLTPKGESLEGRGVWPERELTYKWDEARLGKDSWILRALE